MAGADSQRYFKQTMAGMLVPATTPASALAERKFLSLILRRSQKLHIHSFFLTA